MTFQPLAPLWLLLPLAAALISLLALKLRAASAPRALWFRRMGIVLAVTVFGLGPAAPGEVVQLTGRMDVYLVVDRTGSMAAEDWGAGQPRLEGVRADIDAIAEGFPGARFSIIAWDSEASRQLPLTTDTRAVRSWAATLRQETTAYSAGTAIDRPLETLRFALEDGQANWPGNARVVFFLSDGEINAGTASDPVASYAELAPLVDGGAVLGYGTAAGGKMRIADVRGTATEYIADPSGGDAVSRLDEPRLRGLAAALGVDYETRTEANELDTAATAAVAAAQSEGGASDLRYRYLGWPLVWLAAGLLAVEIAIELRRLRVLGGFRG